MKLKFSHFCFSFLLLGVAANVAFAQSQHEGLSPREFQDPTHQELNLNDDKTLLFEQEPKVKGKDSVITSHSRPGVLSSSKSKPIKPFTGKNEDDALSFNFLYYIIEKFKISDLVDQ